MKNRYKNFLRVFTLFSFFTFLLTYDSYAQFGCGTGVPITNGYTQMGITTPGTAGIEDWNTNPTGTSINSSYWDDDVYLFEYTAGATAENISMTIFTRNGWNGIGIFDDCTGTTFSTELDAVGTTTANVSNTVSATIAAGNTVYIAVGQWGTPNDLDFDVTDFTVTQILCPAPSALTVTNLTSTTADLGWTENGTATTWDIEWDTAGFTPTGIPTIVGTTTNPHNLTGLTAQTAYEFYVRADCGGSGTSTWVGPFAFTTTCGVITPDHTEPFNTFVPDICWDEADGGDLTSGPTSLGASPWTAGTAIGNTAKINLYTDSRSDWILSPYFDLSAGGYEIVIDVAVTNYNSSATDVMGSDDSVRVAYTEDGLTWNTLMVFTAADNLPNSLSTFNALIPSVGNNVQFGILATDGPINDAEDYDFHVDNFIIRTPPSCPAPSALTVTNLTSTTADLGWTENGTATTWDIEWDTAGFTPTGIPTIVGTTTNPHNLTGLTAQTAYEFYVRADCGGSGTSTWAGPFAFTTLCGIITPDHTEPFNTFVPDICWDEADGGDLTSGPTSLGASPWTAGTAIGNTAKINLYTDSRSDWILSPYFDLSAGGYEIVIDVAVTDWNASGSDVMGADDSVRVVYTENGSTWNTLMVFTVADNLPNSLTTFSTLIPSVGNNVQFGILATDGPVDNTQDYDFHVDNFIIRTPPSCPAPSALTVTNLTSTTADLGWTENGTATTWDIEWDTAGFTPTGIPTIVGTTTNPHNLTGLTANTSYEFYVRAMCSVSDSSAWVGPYSFFTGYCIPSSTSSSTYINNFTTIGGSLNISNLASGFTTGGYLDATAQIVESYPNGTFDFNAEIVGGTVGLSIWVDWNNDLIFDNLTEKVFNTTAFSNGPFTSTITIPGTTSIGNYRMRVTADWNDDNPSDPCAARPRAEFEDYTISIVAPPSCPAPSALTVTNLTSTTADLGWTENGTATIWDIEWGAAGFTPTGIPTIVGTTTNPHNLIGLTAETAYEFYVRSMCSASDSSNWVGPFAFTTPCNSVTTFPFLEDFETTSNTRDCWSQIQEVGTGSWTYATGSTGGSITTAYSGTENAQFVSQSGTNSPIVKLVSPILDLSAVNTPELAFFYGQEDWSGDQNELKVYYRTSAATAWIQIAHYTTDVPAWTADTLTLPNPSATYQIAFEGINNYGRANVVDDVEVYDAITCSDPSNLTAFNIQPTSAMLDWTENGTATNWNIEWDVTGFTLGTGNPQAVAAKPYLLQGLTPGTAYDYYVQADCGLGDTSNWVGPFTFTTPPCMPIVVDLGADTTLCSNQSILLDAGAGNYTYMWSTGGTAQTELVDTNLMGGNGTYNITVTITDNLSGCFYTDDINVTFQLCTDIDELGNGNAIAIYPNPTNGLLNVMINGVTVNTTLTIVDVQGKIVYSKNNFTNSASLVETIDLSGNDKGIYFINLTTDKTTIVKKVILH